MKKTLLTLIALMFAVVMAQPVIAAEHGGKEHGGTAKGSMQEHGGKERGGEAVKAANKIPPTNEDIRNAMKSYVDSQSEQHDGKYFIKDPDTGEMLGLALERVHERVGKTGDYYYSCADFRDENGKLWDLDIDVADNGGQLKVVDVRIHKEDGTASYSYDDKDNRFPVVEGTKRHLGSKASAMGELKGEHKGSMKEVAKEHGGKSHAQEHGGKEHGGN